MIKTGIKDILWSHFKDAINLQYSVFFFSEELVSSEMMNELL